MENKKVREAKLLNGETALSVLSQKCQRVYWKTFSNKCTFVYSLSRFIEYRITISQRRKTKAIKLFNMSQCLLCCEGSLICPTTEQIIVEKYKYFLQSGSGERGGGGARGGLLEGLVGDQVPTFYPDHTYLLNCTAVRHGYETNHLRPLKRQAVNFAYLCKHVNALYITCLSFPPVLIHKR